MYEARVLMDADPPLFEEKRVMMNQDSLSDSAFPVCRRCHQHIKPTSEEDILDRFGGFARLRCSVTDCGHEDWYKEPILIVAPDVAPPAPEGPGEVWIHDVILGLSFRAESGTSLDAGMTTDISH
jgi:hypothetical protein